ncbi:MAG: hypothetical protein JJU05_19080 [Verrucomicrobia bacterium]|nr:hypothetical protein [Verrucomicrobiota bacterium]MCH8528920.1 DUF4139 domain-containing protein [Kiritimatiellia bacterium]
MKKLAKTILLVTVMMVTALPRLVAEASAPPPRISSRPVRLALFKNGLGFVEREGEMPAGVETGEFGVLPIPVHGTFWVDPVTEGVEIKGLVAGSEPLAGAAIERDVGSLTELLEANPGRELELVILGPDGKPESLTATVRILRRDAGETPAEFEAESGFVDPLVTSSNLPHPSHSHMHRSVPQRQPSSAAALLLLEAEAGQWVIDSSSVRQVRGQDLHYRTHDKAADQTRASLMLNVSGNDEGAKLKISYLAKGITWAPSYRLDLLDDQTVRIHAKAQIINDLEDFENVEVHAIAGFPNLSFANVVDPMAFQGSLAGWLQHLTSPEPARTRRESVVTQQMVTMNVLQPGSGGVLADFDPDSFAERGDSDLFFYSLENVNLKRGERGYYPLFTSEVPYESVYDCHISDTQQNERNRGETFAEDVWHALRLSNTSKMPWTTAPALVMRNGMIMGQDTLYYTSLGGQTLLRFSKALDVRVSSVEREIERERNVRYRNSTWNLVTVEGTISLVNLKPVAVTVTVRRTVEGEITLNPFDAGLTVPRSGITAVNPTSDLTWEVNIPPRETAELSYTFQRYVR